MFVPSHSLLVLDYSSMVTLMRISLSLDGGGGDLILPFLGDLGWEEKNGYSRCDLGSGGITVYS